MKYIFIDSNQRFTKAFSDKLSSGKQNSHYSLSGDDISMELDNVIYETVNGDAKCNVKAEDIFFINCETKIISKRQHFNGIEVLKWLRLKGIDNHCVLYSSMSIQALSRLDPTFCIILSKGVSFIQIPFSPESLKELQLNEFAERENLLHFFRGEINIESIRHELGNLWGLERLKFLLDISQNNYRNNFSLELLRYLNSHRKSKDKLDKSKSKWLINWFNERNFEIIYYDDMADEWGPVLKQMLGNNFNYYTPNTTSEDQLLTLIETKNPKCILLDLRLNNEKEFNNDPLSISGGALLKKIKNSHYHLPVIILTATNKAEKVNKLLAAGAEYVWTKEGVDDGIDDLYTLNNTNELLFRIKDAVCKFPGEIYARIFEAESKINILNKNVKKISRQFIPILNAGILKDIDTIVIDTNFFIDGLATNPGYLELFYQVLLANSSQDNIKKKQVVIHEDVYSEMYIISRLDEKEIRDGILHNKLRVPICQLLVRLLQSWIKKELVFIHKDDGQTNAIKENLKLDITSLLKPSIVSGEEFIAYSMIESLQIRLSDMLKRTKLDADDPLSIIVPKYVSSGNVLFITSDQELAYKVGEKFVNGENIQKRIYERYRAGKFKKTGIHNATVENHQYRHLENNAFIKLFK